MKTKSSFPASVPISGRVKICIDLVKKQQVKGKIIVDIGSSFGWLEKEIQKLKPKKLIGVELNYEAVNFAKKNVADGEFLIGNAIKLPVKKNFADIAILFDVIEHLPTGSETKALKEANRILKKGGILLFSTPHSHPLSNLFDIAWYFGHRHYSEKAVSRMLDSEGFKILNMEIKGSIISSIYLTWFYIAKRVLKSIQPRNLFLESFDDKGYQGRGITDIFLVSKKIN